MRINPYKEWTSDWSRTPDGHYYSNKAPGPVLAAFPVYWLLDRAVTGGIADRAARDAARYRFKPRLLKALSWLFQVIPFALLSALALSHLSGSAAHAAALAMLFGNTAAFFMNTFFGHGFTAVWALGAGLALTRRRPALFGLCLGWALLSDYGSLCLLPPALWAWGRREGVGRIALGALFPAALWIAYHQICFGSPFVLANRYQNPLFVDVAAEGVNLWGVLTLPRPEILGELLFGAERGLLPTQPWIFAVAAFALAYPLGRLAAGALALLLVMNASFGGWHGGLTPGPRYLSAVLPLFGWLLGLQWERRGRLFRALAGSGLTLSILFFVLVFATHISTQLVPLWPTYLHIAFVTPTPTTLLRLALLIPLFGGTLVWILRRRRVRWSP